MLNETQLKSFLDTCKEKINSYRTQNKHIYFSAKFFRKNKQVEAIEKGEIDTFSRLIRSYTKTETPDRIVVLFFEQNTKAQLYKKELIAENDEVVDKIVENQSSPTLMGVDVVQDLVRKGINEYREEQEKAVLRRRLKRSLGIISQKEEEIEALEKEIKRLEGELEDIEDTVTMDKRIKGYVAIAGEAFPGLNGLIQKSSLRGLLGIPKEEMEIQESTEDTAQVEPTVYEDVPIDPKRKQMIDIISAYFSNEENSTDELHKLYMLIYQVTLKPEILPTLLELASGEQTES